MWMTAPNRIGIAAWQAGDSVWRVEALGGREGVAILIGDTSLSLGSSDDRLLPALDEQYVRGDELHLSFPQSDPSSSVPDAKAPEGECEFGFRLVLRPVAFDGFSTNNDRCVFEMLVSIQTTLLDAHPTLDLTMTTSHSARSVEVESTKNAVHLGANTSFSAAVLLGPQDAPFTGVIDEPGSLRLRLFGEFLEKGVIRRARPWVVLDRSESEIDGEFVRGGWKALADSPLPLG